MTSIKVIYYRLRCYDGGYFNQGNICKHHDGGWGKDEYDEDCERADVIPYKGHEGLLVIPIYCKHVRKEEVRFEKQVKRYELDADYLVVGKHEIPVHRIRRLIIDGEEILSDCERLAGESEDYRRGYSKGYDDGLAVAKKETETQKITQNSNANLRNTDLIRRVEAVKKLNRIGRDYGLSFSDIDVAEYIIRNLPSASEPMGEWEYDVDADDSFCTNCHKYAIRDMEMQLESDFCPNCGARMGGGE